MIALLKRGSDFLIGQPPLHGGVQLARLDDRLQVGDGDILLGDDLVRRLSSQIRKAPDSPGRFTSRPIHRFASIALEATLNPIVGIRTAKGPVGGSLVQATLGHGHD